MAPDNRLCSVSLRNIFLVCGQYLILLRAPAGDCDMFPPPHITQLTSSGQCPIISQPGTLRPQTTVGKLINGTFFGLVFGPQVTQLALSFSWMGSPQGLIHINWKNDDFCVILCFIIEKRYHLLGSWLYHIPTFTILCQTHRQTGSGWWITNSDHKSYCRLMIRSRGAQGVILFFTLLTVCWSWAELAKTFFIIFTSKLYDELMLIFLFASVGCLQLHSWPLCCLKNKNYCRLSIDSVQRGKNKSQIWKSFELIWEI